LSVDSASTVVGAYTTDRKYFMLFQGTVSQYLDMFYIKASDLFQKKINWRRLCTRDEEIRNYCTFNDTIFAIKVGADGRSAIVATSLKKPDFKHARIVIRAEGREIVNIDRTLNFMYFVESDGINKTLCQYSFKSRLTNEIKAPRTGNLDLKICAAETDQCSFQLTSWTHLHELLKFDAEHGKFVRSPFDRSVDMPQMESVEVKEIEVRGHDGVMIPLSLIYSIDTKLDGSSYCVLFGYGAYGYGLEPLFYPQLPFLIKHHIIYAIAHVRGGGEKGESWHTAGLKQTKPNTWKDFISCAEYLIAQKYTSGNKLVAESASAGGILIGRAITERPDLFGGAITVAGDCNALLSETTQSGQNNIAEFGSAKVQAECKALAEMDALSHVKAGTRYPAVLCTVGMNDHRVEPWSSGKFVAALQNASTSGKPVMLRVDYNNGHFTDNRSVDFKQTADIYAYIFWALGHPEFKMK